MPAQPPIVVTDSNASLPRAVIAGLPLITVPLQIHHQGKSYRDGVDIDPDAFYALQRQDGPLPTTSAPLPGDFLQAFHDASARASDVVCVTLSSELSATYEAAEQAKEQAATELPGLRIVLVDSRSAGTAQGLIALEGARCAASGGDVEAVLAAVDRRMNDTVLYGFLDTLYYVWKGGRVPRVLMWMGKLLSVKPLLELDGGKIGMVERPRTERRAMERIVALTEQRLGGRRARVAVMHASASALAEDLAGRLRSTLNIEELFITEFTPVIGAHTGPGLVGCAFHPVD